MRAVVCHEYGPFENMAVEETPPPERTSNGVRIAVEASGVGFAAALVIAGRHQNRPPLPFIPGTEIAGTVIDGADGFAPGDRVCAGVRWGGFAEQAVADAGNVFKIPDAMDFAAATHFPTIYATGYGGLVWRAALQTDETLLVHGAAGASGLAAVEIGKAVGATVIATAGTDEKCKIAATHGADHVINYRENDFRDAVLKLTGGRGADVIYDPVGGDVFDQSLRCIAPEGRILPMGFAGGTIPKAPANILLVKNVSVIGLYWGYYMGWGKLPAPPKARARVREAMAHMFQWYEAGKLRPLTQAELPLDRFAEALATVMERRVIGKVVLTPLSAP